MRYNPKAIEAKWQTVWKEKKLFKASIDPKKPKYYILDMFPYLSGSGLHVGHAVGYTATDILARYKRQKGFNVLHPMGWDSFGLPAEQHAIRTGTHPAITTKKNMDSFRRQLQAFGFSYDWDREFATSDPSYYKWTQWIFTKLYEKGLAYEAEMPVNYCPALGTVLANEEVENGRSKEGGFDVERRPLKQWVLKITSYAERLLKDLELLDWPEHLKRLQANWIGRSEGAMIDFEIVGISEKLTVFTTRPDTLFGATYLVLAPENPLLKKIQTPSQAPYVESYAKEAALKNDLERSDLAKEKTGVFTGAMAINPVTHQEIPIWISDYVLMTYGTGAIMAVPAHDERDFEFAQKFNLPIQCVFDPDFHAHPESVPSDISHEALKKEILEGHRSWSGEGRAINSHNEGISLDGLPVEEAKSHIVAYLEKKNIGKEAISYKLRDWLFSRQRYWGEPFPILHFEDGTKRLLDLDELPLNPPNLSDFKPTGDGHSPLARVRQWVEIIDPKTGKKALRETNTMPQWAGSCWYYLRFCDPHNDSAAWDPQAEKYWMPVDLYVGGVEHAVLHLLYARFWHKVLYDCGLVSTLEPFMTLRNQGLIVARAFQDSHHHYVPVDDVQELHGKYIRRSTGEELSAQMEKMSKSKLNGVSPDDLIEEFGADALRLYEMFMGPLDKEKAWNTDAIQGGYRFLSRFYEMATSDAVTDEETEEALRLGHRLVHGVEADIESLQFNTAIAKMMEFINDFTKLPRYPKSVIKMATAALMPFAPHLAEEVWHHLGFKEVLAYYPFPKAEEKYLFEENVTVVIQVNGRVRSRLNLKKGLTQEELLTLAKQDEKVSRHLDGKKLVNSFHVPDKLLNLVTD